MTLAGSGTQILTHSIDLKLNRQDVLPVVIGDYTFIGTRTTILMGSVIPAYSILGACSLFTGRFEESYKLYGGVPAKVVRDLTGVSIEYFKRTNGFVV